LLGPSQSTSSRLPTRTFENPAIRFVYHFEQILISLFFDVFVDLIGISALEYRAVVSNETQKHYRIGFARPKARVCL
jgi:hypothetical protein